MDLLYNTRITKGLKLFHSFGIVINSDAIIGQKVTIRQNTTIGQARESSGVPIIGNNVNIGSNCTVIGEISIGDNCTIGAGSVVTKSFPPNSVIIGNPGKVIGNTDFE